MKNKLISVIVSLILVFGVLPLKIQAVDTLSGGSATTADELNTILGGVHTVEGNKVTLTENVNVFNAAGFNITGGDLTLDLAGFVIDSPYVTAFNVSSGAALTVMDSSVAATGIIKSGWGESSLHGIRVDGGTLTINSGSIESYGNGDNSSGIYLIAGTVTINGGSLAYTNNTATMGSGLTIAGGTATITGGSLTGVFGIYLNGWGSVNISGSTSISGTTGINASVGTVNISGGSVTGTSEAIKVSNNGTINVSAGAAINGDLKMQGGTLSISGGSVSGFLAVSGGTTEVTGGTINQMTVSGGTVSVSGSTQGYAQLSGGETTITGGSFTNNMAGLNIKGTAKLNFSGGSIIGEVIGLLVTGGETIITGGTITGTKAGWSSGVSISDGKVTISGGTITGNSAGYDKQYASLYMSGGELYFAGVPGKTALILNNYEYPETIAPNYLKLAVGTVTISPNTKIKFGSADYTKYLTGGTVASHIYEDIRITAMDPNIATHPQNVSVTRGNTANFTVSATGSTVLSYQWQVSTDSGSTWNDVTDGTGITTNSYTTIATTTDMSGYQYHCLVTNSQGAETSQAAELTTTAPVANISLSYNANGGSGVVPSSVMQSISTTIAVASGGGLSRANYTFAGWNTLASGNGTVYAVGSTFTFTSSTVLYAQWTANPTSSTDTGGSSNNSSTTGTNNNSSLSTSATVTLSYDANGGSGVAPVTVTQALDTTATVFDGNSLFKTDYTFAGWNTVADGSGTVYAVNSIFEFTEDTILYAQWKIQPVLTSSVTSGTISVGGIITLTPNIDGGTWDWDKEFFTATFNSPATFTALKAGTSTINYTVDETAITYNVLIATSELPAADQDNTFVYVIAGLTTLAFVVIIINAIYKRRKKV